MRARAREEQGTTDQSRDKVGTTKEALVHKHGERHRMDIFPVACKLIWSKEKDKKMMGCWSEARQKDWLPEWWQVDGKGTRHTGRGWRISLPLCVWACMCYYERMFNDHSLHHEVQWPFLEMVTMSIPVELSSQFSFVIQIKWMDMEPKNRCSVQTIPLRIKKNLSTNLSSIILDIRGPFG